MPKDRTGEERPPDDLFSGPHPAGCDHGQIEEHYDAGGNLLGHYRWDPAFARVARLVPAPTPEDPDATIIEYDDLVERSITYPCPRCRPAQHARWAAGCYRMDGTHDHAHCTYCQEDGRHAPKPPR